MTESQTSSNKQNSTMAMNTGLISPLFDVAYKPTAAVNACIMVIPKFNYFGSPLILQQKPLMNPK